MIRIAPLKEQLRNLDFFNSIFLSSRYYVTLEETDDLIALIDATEKTAIYGEVSIATKSLNSSSDAAVQKLRASANGKDPNRGEEYWKNGPLPIPQAYADFYFFFIQPLNLEWNQAGPVSYTNLPDGTRVNVYPIALTKQAPTIAAIERPFGAVPKYLKMRYLLPGDQLP